MLSVQALNKSILAHENKLHNVAGVLHNIVRCFAVVGSFKSSTSASRFLDVIEGILGGSGTFLNRSPKLTFFCTESYLFSSDYVHPTIWKEGSPQ